MLNAAMQQQRLQAPGVRPPAPGVRPPAPGSRPSTSGAGKAPALDQKQPGKRKSRYHLYPARTAVTLLICLALGAVYYGVRAARIGDQAAVVSPDGLSLSFELPDGWKLAQQGGVSGGTARWAAGPAGSRDQAVFLTRYQLNRDTDGGTGRKHALAEARESLKRTGAPSSIKRTDGKLGGKDADQYRFKQGNLAVRVMLHVEKDTLYEVACQSRQGGRGAPLRKGCAQIIRTAEFD